MTHLIELLPPPEGESQSITVDKLPLGTVTKLKNSSLAYHLVNDDGPAAIVSNWSEFSGNPTLVTVAKKEEEDEIPF
jgi:hypothetical protein